jgi:tripeptide aminopeptidase
VRPPSEAERRRLHERFEGLCRIPSPSGQEAACAAEVRSALTGFGLAVDDDPAGNLLARIPGRSERTVLLCAHLDTVPAAGPIEPVVVDDGWQNAQPAILGADNKAAVAVLLGVAERCAIEGAPVALELLFTVQEENALAGAKAFDASALRAEWGYVFDHATPIGEVIAAAPTCYRLEACFHGRPAHAGIRPEDGRSAIVAAARAICALPNGRLDEGTTANIGSIAGGVAGTNVVPERCTFLGEVRALDEARAEAVVREMVDAVHDAANAPDCDVDVDVTVERVYTGYRHRPDLPAVRAAERALRACGYDPRPVTTGGGSDANALMAQDLPCVCLANGTERAHEADERVSFAALEGMLGVALELVGACSS